MPQDVNQEYEQKLKEYNSKNWWLKLLENPPVSPKEQAEATKRTQIRANEAGGKKKSIADEILKTE